MRLAIAHPFPVSYRALRVLEQAWGAFTPFLAFRHREPRIVF